MIRWLPTSDGPFFFLFFENGKNFISPRKEVDYTSNARSVRDALSRKSISQHIFHERHVETKKTKMEKENGCPPPN